MGWDPLTLPLLPYGELTDIDINFKDVKLAEALKEIVPTLEQESIILWWPGDWQEKLDSKLISVE